MLDLIYTLSSYIMMVIEKSLLLKEIMKKSMNTKNNSFLLSLFDMNIKMVKIKIYMRFYGNLEV